MTELLLGECGHSLLAFSGTFVVLNHFSVMCEKKLDLFRSQFCSSVYKVLMSVLRDLQLPIVLFIRTVCDSELLKSLEGLYTMSLKGIHINFPYVKCSTISHRIACLISSSIPFLSLSK